MHSLHLLSSSFEEFRDVYFGPNAIINSFYFCNRRLICFVQDMTWAIQVKANKIQISM